ncbi:hypothetical protein ABG768_017298, partial [Culter alburnus]
WFTNDPPPVGSRCSVEGEPQAPSSSVLSGRLSTLPAGKRPSALHASELQVSRHDRADQG